MKSLITRSIALIATTTFALTAAAGPSQAAPTPADKAESWLGNQLTSGVVHNGEFDFDDYGLTLDFAAAFAAAGNTARLDAIETAMATHVDDYTTYDTFDADNQPTGKHISAGAVAKLAVFVQSQKLDLANYGGVNLQRRLQARIATATPIRGRLQDKVTTGQFEADYANVIGQAYAVRALTNAASPQARAATAFLLKQQCADGFYRLNFATSKTSTRQSCADGNATVSAPDTDTTALVVLALDAIKSPTPEVKASIRLAVKWLKTQQKQNGSFGGGVSTEGSNSNSTGLASWALGERNSCVAANMAANWLVGRQVIRATVGSALADDIGAVAYNRKAYREVVAVQEITEAQRDQWRRATAQAMPGLLNVDLAACQAR